ncbi:MAG: hypothetical protein OEN02_08535, partial [Gammaproteobacteria bacterium]|nr:hypothetical protein [Gammaproteobacteria bacterium]
MICVEKRGLSPIRRFPIAAQKKLWQFEPEQCDYLEERKADQVKAVSLYLHPCGLIACPCLWT